MERAGAARRAAEGCRSGCEVVQPGSPPGPAPRRPMMSLTPSRGCLLDLPWEDILVPHILCHLPLQQLLSLQRVSRAFQALIQLYLANMRCFDSTQASFGLPVQIGGLHPSGCFVNLLEGQRSAAAAVPPELLRVADDRELLPVIGQNQHLQRGPAEGLRPAEPPRAGGPVPQLPRPQAPLPGPLRVGWTAWPCAAWPTHCPGLQALDLTACRQLKDEAICYLCTSVEASSPCPWLSTPTWATPPWRRSPGAAPSWSNLDLTGCLRVKNDSIRY
ncbi:F-box/LRR-repeat protein 15 [Calypte anna]|uniref:F-box/LRR-repeat protein 15 n=1 Tax=Calypte anna TaxID=9244 RepID=UPI0011C45D69|nr:F-box/LRR-repeat protein 15 [Calypte anna]